MPARAGGPVIHARSVSVGVLVAMAFIMLVVMVMAVDKREDGLVYRSALSRVAGKAR